MIINKRKVIFICDCVKNAPDTLQGGYTTRELQMYRAACDRIATEIEKLSQESERMPKPEQFRIKTGEADLNEKQKQTMGENIGNGLIKVGVSQEDLEESIAGLRELKPILQQQVMIGNGRDTKQGLKDAAELGKHFDTAIDAMTILLSGFPDYQK